MVFDKVRFGKEEIFTTIVEDIDGRELERWKVMKKDFPNVFKILANKFGIKAKIVNKYEYEKDLEWALK